MGNKRISDLKMALQLGQYRNGNHFIKYIDGITTMESNICSGDGSRICEHLTYCLVKECSPPLRSNTIDADKVCVKEGARIEFYYHDTLCLSFNLMNGCTTDHGMWGYSVTTARSIRWYLEALIANNLVACIPAATAQALATRQSIVNLANICKQFKKRPKADKNIWIPLCY